MPRTVESKSTSGVISTCSNPWMTPVGHTEDAIAYIVSLLWNLLSFLPKCNTSLIIFGFEYIVPNIIRIYRECEGMIEKSVPRIIVWHHEACRVMTNIGPERRIFLSNPHTNNGMFSCSTLFLYPEVPEYAKIHDDVTLT